MTRRAPPPWRQAAPQRVFLLDRGDAVRLCLEPSDVASAKGAARFQETGVQAPLIVPSQAFDDVVQNRRVGGRHFSDDPDGGGGVVRQQPGHDVGNVSRESPPRPCFGEQTQRQPLCILGRKSVEHQHPLWPRALIVSERTVSVGANGELVERHRERSVGGLAPEGLQFVERQCTQQRQRQRIRRALALCFGGCRCLICRERGRGCSVDEGGDTKDETDDDDDADDNDDDDNADDADGVNSGSRRNEVDSDGDDGGERATRGDDKTIEEDRGSDAISRLWARSPRCATKSTFFFFQRRWNQRRCVCDRTAPTRRQVRPAAGAQPGDFRNVRRRRFAPSFEESGVFYGRQIKLGHAQSGARDQEGRSRIAVARRCFHSACCRFHSACCRFHSRRSRSSFFCRRQWPST